MSAIKARSRKPACVLVSMLASRRRASSASSTGVLPDFTTCDGPRTEAAVLIGTIWPITSQSNRCRSAARRCLTVGGDSARVWASIHVATCSGCKRRSRRSSYPCTSLETRWPHGHRPGACAGCECSRRRIPESGAQPRPPVAAIRAGREDDGRAKVVTLFKSL